MQQTEEYGTKRNMPCQTAAVEDQGRAELQREMGTVNSLKRGRICLGRLTALPRPPARPPAGIPSHSLIQLCLLELSSARPTSPNPTPASRPDQGAPLQQAPQRDTISSYHKLRCQPERGEAWGPRPPAPSGPWGAQSALAPRHEAPAA